MMKAGWLARLLAYAPGYIDVLRIPTPVGDSRRRSCLSGSLTRSRAGVLSENRSRGGRCGAPLAGPQPDKTVVAPAFAADAMADEEQFVGVVAPFHREQQRVMRAPVRCLPILLEVVALGDVGAAIGRQRFQDTHGAVDLRGLVARVGELGLVPGEAGVSRRTFAGDNRKHERVEHRGIGRGV